jgi:bacteriorhodopsin
VSDLMQTSTQETWLWIGTIGMALGAFVIYALGAKMQERHHQITSFFVCAIAACMYLLMAFGQGDVVVSKATLAITPVGVGADINAELVYWARYLDWVVTTPLLLLGLVTVGLKAISGALSLDDNHKYVWFAISCGFFLAVLILVWGPVRASAAAQGAGVASLYNKLLGILTVLWFIYPILWILGTEGTGTISLNTEVIVFTIIDLSAKVGFGILLVTGVKKLESAGSGSAAPAAASS